MSLFDQEDDNIDYVAELAGPGKKFDRTKYSSDEEMMKAVFKGKYHGDKTLDQRNREFDELREDAMKWRNDSTAKARFEEFFENRSKNLEDDNSGRTLTPVNVEPALDPAKLDDLLEAKLVAREAKKTAEANVAEVENRLLERFGDNAQSVLRDKMKTLGLSDEDIKFLARKSPEAALNALGLNSQTTESFQSPPRSSFRSDNFSPQADIRDAVFYEKMRREQPKLYFSTKVSVQRLEDMDHPDFMTRFNQRKQV